MARVHVIGAGLAGLAASVALAEHGWPVVLHEQAAHAGGRARSFHDASLDRRIDNGNHLLLSGNKSALDYLATINATHELTGPGRARFDFLDIGTRERWSIDLNRGPVPMWVMYKSRRVPGTGMTDYLAGLKLLTAGDRTVASLFGAQKQLYRRFWEPFSVAVLNTPPDVAVARMLTPVIRETLAKGAGASRPLVAKTGLSETFVAPGLAYLERRGAGICFNNRISAINFEDSRVTSLAAGGRLEQVARDDMVVLAAPPWAARTLVPGLDAPDEFAPIVNVHFMVAGPPPPADAGPLGMIGGTAQWLFVRGSIASVTVSAAYELADLDAKAIAAKIRPEVAAALGLEEAALAKCRVIKERRASFVCTPEQLAKRPRAQTKYANLVLAGDWTDTQLPATIEGAIRSGQTAARLCLEKM